MSGQVHLGGAKPTSSMYRARFGVHKMTSTVVNTRTVTAKQVKDASQQQKHGGRFVLDNSQLYTVRLCGQVISIDQNETHTNFTLYDGTATLNARVWPSNGAGETEMTGAMINSYYEVIANVLTEQGHVLLQTIKATRVVDHNTITMHMLAAIHEHCELGKLRNKDVSRWEDAEGSARRYMKTNLSFQLDKEAIESILSTDAIRNSDAGATTAYIKDHLHLDEQSTRKTLQKMVDEGSIYNTTDYDHFKLADEN